MKRDERLAERGGVARVERGVPLAVLLAEAHDDDVGALDQRPRADRVDPGADVVLPERALFVAEDRDAAVVARRVVGDRPAELDVEAGLGDALRDPLAPVGVDLAREVDLPVHADMVARRRARPRPVLWHPVADGAEHRRRAGGPALGLVVAAPGP